jgi:putative DNA-invertase from lambdoid prophage Rac
MQIALNKRKVRPNRNRASKPAVFLNKMSTRNPNVFPNSGSDRKRALIYSRVSTKDQELENQLRQLREYAATQNWDVIEIICDVASGGKDANERQGLGRVLLLAQQRKFDVLLFWSLDRLSREGSRKTIGYLTTLEQHGADFHSYSEPYLSTLGIFKDALIALLSALAKQERARISERTKAGLERAKAAGKQLGRPKTSNAKMEQARKLRGEGLSYREIAARLGCSRVWAFELANSKL